MKVHLHIGAHRCATTSFQFYMRQNAARLSAQGVAFWGPLRTRTGLFQGIQPGPRRAFLRDPRARGLGRVRLNCARLEAAGIAALVVSDENMMGSVRQNLRLTSLYCGVGERIARYSEAFEGRLETVIVNTRSLEWYWASAMGYGLTRGMRVPTPAQLNRIAADARGWREVIGDIACAAGGAPVRVLPFETFAGRPEAQLAAITDAAPPPRDHARTWRNATPRLPALRKIRADLPPGEGRWQPFDIAQRAALRERYADDMMWLRAGAEGLATLIDDRQSTGSGMNRPGTDLTRGNRHDEKDRRMARAGGG